MPVKRRSEQQRDTRRGRGKDDDDDRYAPDEDEEEDRGRRRRSRDDDDDRDGDRDRRPTRRARDEEDDDDERPRSRRPARDDDEDDRRGGRSARRDRDDDAEEDDDQRRGRGRGRRDEERPRSDRRSGERDRDRGRDDDDRRSADRERSSAVRSGWAGAHRTRDQSSGYANTFKPEAGKDYIGLFLDDEPYASWRMHWVDRAGKRSFVCPEDPDDKKSPRCPLCDIDQPRALYGFNIAVWEPDDREPRVLSWEVGIRLLQQFEKLNDDPRTGPLSAPYFHISRTGKGTSSVTAVQPIKERDLYNDWGVDPLEDEDLADLRRKKYDASIVQPAGMSDLKAMVKELTKYDD